MKVVPKYQRIFVLFCVLLGIFIFFLGRFSVSLESVLLSAGSEELSIMEKVQPKKLLSTYLMILIMTSPEKFVIRKVIRDTWLKLSTKTPVLFQYAFPVGTKNLSTIAKKQIYEENEQYHDLIFLDNLADSYNKLSVKTGLSIRFAVENYDFNFLLKVDSDSFVRLGSLLKSLKDIEHPRLYWGFLDGRAKPFRKGKWKEPSGWMLCDRYLPYQLGGGYIIAHSLAKYIAKNFELLKFYQSEDVAVGAWLAGLDVKYVHDPRFDTEFTSRGCNNEYLITHKTSVESMKVLFSNVRDKGVLCIKEFQTRPSYVYDFSSPTSQCCIRRNDSGIP